MDKKTIEKIKANPDYQKLVKERTAFSIKLSIAMLVAYFAFILTIAFDPALLGTPMSDGGVTSVGIPIGIAIIVFAFVLTGIYTKRANSEFDDLNNAVKKSVGEE